MMRNSCENCKKYYPNQVIYSCPECGESLENRLNDKSYVAHVWNEEQGRSIPIAASNKCAKKNVNEQSVQRRNSEVGAPPPICSDPPAQPQRLRRAYAGIINNYERFDVGEQNFFERVSLFFRGMHYGNTRHVITFVDEGDNQTYRVCFYGEFYATRSAIPQIGERIVIGGRPRGSTFDSENVYIGEGYGRRIRLRSQNLNRRINPITTLVVIIVLLALLFIAHMALNGELAIIGEAIKIFAIATIVMFVIGLIFFSGRLRFRTLAILSVVIGVGYTAVSYNVGGIANQISAVMPIVLILVLSVYGVWLIITGGRR